VVSNRLNRVHNYDELYLLGCHEVKYYKSIAVLEDAARKIIEENYTTQNQPPCVRIQLSQNRGVTLCYSDYTAKVEKTPLLAEITSKTTYQCSFSFGLENVSFCGHPFRSDKYFGFIVRKSTDSNRFCCIVTVSKTSTKPISRNIASMFRRMQEEIIERISIPEEEYLDD